MFMEGGNGTVGEERYFEGILQWVFFFFFFNLLAMLHVVYGILIPREGIRPKLQSLNCQGSPCGGS